MATEYALIIGLIAVVVMLGLQALGTSVTSLFQSAVNMFGG